MKTSILWPSQKLWKKTSNKTVFGSGSSAKKFTIKQNVDQIKRPERIFEPKFVRRLSSFAWKCSCYMVHLIRRLNIVDALHWHWQQKNLIQLLVRDFCHPDLRPNEAKWYFVSHMQYSNDCLWSRLNCSLTQDRMNESQWSQKKDTSKYLFTNITQL